MGSARARRADTGRRGGAPPGSGRRVRSGPGLPDLALRERDHVRGRRTRRGRRRARSSPGPPATTAASSTSHVRRDNRVVEHDGGVRGLRVVGHALHLDRSPGVPARSRASGAVCVPGRCSPDVRRENVDRGAGHARPRRPAAASAGRAVSRAAGSVTQAAANDAGPGRHGRSRRRPAASGIPLDVGDDCRSPGDRGLDDRRTGSPSDRLDRTTTCPASNACDTGDTGPRGGAPSRFQAPRRAPAFRRVPSLPVGRRRRTAWSRVSGTAPADQGEGADEGGDVLEGVDFVGEHESRYAVPVSLSLRSSRLEPVVEGADLVAACSGWGRLPAG